MNRDSCSTALDILIQLIRAQRTGEAAVQGMITQIMEDSGLAVRKLNYNPSAIPLRVEFATRLDKCASRTAVIGELPGRSGLPRILLLAHPDCEPLSGLDDWSKDPFAGEIAEGRLYGWGVGDDLAGCSAALAALAHIGSAGQRLGDVTFASTPSKNHARGIAAVLADDRRFDACLYLHPAESGRGLGEIKAVTPGQLEFEIDVAGEGPDTTEPSQTSFSHQARNPVYMAMTCIQALLSLGEIRSSHIRHAGIEAVAGRATNLHISRMSSSEISALSRIPDHCTFGGAISFPPDECLEEVKDAIAGALSSACQGDSWLRENPARLRWISGVPGAGIAETHPLYRITSRAIEDVTCCSPSVNSTHVSSDIRFPIFQFGIPCVGIGCLGGNLAQNGFADEWVDVKSYLQMSDVTSLIVQRWGQQGVRIEAGRAEKEFA